GFEMNTTRVAGLLVVFVFAKLIALAGHDVPLSWWSPIAYLWQDALVVLVFAAVNFWLGRRTRLAWTVYAAVALYVGLNIPVMRVLSTPLTWPMWGAARGPLADSMWYYATWSNVLLLASAGAVMIVAPPALRRATRLPLFAMLGVCVALGPAAGTRVDTGGLER